MTVNNKLLSGDPDTDTRRVTYMIFMNIIAVLAMIVAVSYYLIDNVHVKEVLRILDFIYATILLFDFFLRLYVIENRRYYIIHWGWLDFVSSIPGIPALRILRGFRVVNSTRQILQTAPDEILAQGRGRLAESVLFIIILLGLVVVTVGSIAIVLVEPGVQGSTIETGSDAMWWSLVTVSTVGYGDEYPVTSTGRIIGTFMIVVGVALFTTVTSYLASNFTDHGARKQRDQQIELAKKNAENLEVVMERLLDLEQKVAVKMGIDAPDEASGEDSS